MNNTLTLNDSERQKILSMICEIGELEHLELDDEMLLQTIPGIDSLGVYRLIGKIELEFFVNLGVEAVYQVETLADLYTIVAKAKEELI